MSDAQDMTTPEAREAYYRAAWEVAAADGNAARRERDDLRGALLLILRWESQATPGGGLASDMAFARRLLDGAWETGGCGVTTVPLPLSLRAETGRYAPCSATAPVSAPDTVIPAEAPLVEPAPELGWACPDCHGLGHFNDRDIGRCVRCNGSGMLPS